MAEANEHANPSSPAADPKAIAHLCAFVAEGSPQPMVAVEGKSHLVCYVNPAFRLLLGIEDQRLLGRRFEDAVPEGLANTCSAMLDRIFATGTSEKLIEQAHGRGTALPGGVEGPDTGQDAGPDAGHKPDATHWSYLAWAILGPDGKPAGVMIQVTDTTEPASFRKVAAAVNEALLVSGLKQHELTDSVLALNTLLRQSEERLQTMADAMPQLATMAKADGAVNWYNKRWYEYTGKTLADMDGWGWQSVHDPKVLPAVIEMWQASLATGEPFEMVFPLRNKDGEFRAFLARVEAFRDANGDVTQWFGTCTDIDDVKRAQEALRSSEVDERKARAEADAANRSKDTFLATLSHELRTPLNAILGWAVLLRTTPPADGKPVDADIEHGLAIIERNARAQGKLIEDVLDVARITSGKFLLDSRPLDLTNLVFAAVDAVRPAAKSKSLKLEVAVAERAGSLWVNGDSSRLQQAISNLLTNAVKFTQKDGSVVVSVDLVKRTDTYANVDTYADTHADTHADTYADTYADTARLTVTDTGRGIDAEFLPSIFERFKQAGEGTTRSYGGLGLGLSVVRHIIEAHGGTARAMSEGEGKGATFTLELPATPHAAAPLRSGQPISTVSLPRLDGVRVLVVDDEEDSRFMAKRALEAAGASVVLAASAEEGYHLAMNGKGGKGGAAEVQVVVSDIGMPGEDGYSMMQRVRKQKGGKDLPAVAVTAFAAPEDKRRALVAGFQTHMAKPIDPHELIAVVAELVGAKVRTQA